MLKMWRASAMKHICSNCLTAMGDPNDGYVRPEKEARINYFGEEEEEES
jgi:hypothetical protein